VDLPDAVGVPDSSPIDLSRASPAGSVPATTECDWELAQGLSLCERPVSRLPLAITNGRKVCGSGDESIARVMHPRLNHESNLCYAQRCYVMVTVR
jgi:hypothetical protein